MINLDEFHAGRYYKSNSGSFYKIEEIHNQENTAGYLVEVSDWIHHPNNPLKANDYERIFEINNGNSLLLVGIAAFSQWQLANVEQLRMAEQRALNHAFTNMINESGAFRIYYRNNERRRDILNDLKALLEKRT